jgi:hypothetical protein
LSAEAKYDLWLRMLTGPLTTVAAAAEAGVDRTTIVTQRKVAKDGAITALQASRPGRPRADRAELSELARLRADNDRLTATIVEQAIELAALRGKPAGLERPDPNSCRWGRRSSTARIGRRRRRRRLAAVADLRAPRARPRPSLAHRQRFDAGVDYAQPVAVLATA